jgi:hypothetical protein
MKETQKSACGTSFFGSTIKMSLNELINILGQPKYFDNSGINKSNVDWILETESGDVFTVYDYKEYRVLSMDEIIEWHIGGNCLSVTEEAKREIIIKEKDNRGI